MSHPKEEVNAKVQQEQNKINQKEDVKKTADALLAPIQISAIGAKLPDSIVKICKVHGDLKEDQIYIRPNGKIECRKCQYISRKASNARNKERVKKLDNEHYARTRDRHLELIMIRKFGITRENYMEMLNKQNNVCAICELSETAKFKRSNKNKLLAIDHCHATNKIRGLLCQKCNSTLGMVGDSVDIIQKMIEYLMVHQNG